MAVSAIAPQAEPLGNDALPPGSPYLIDRRSEEIAGRDRARSAVRESTASRSSVFGATSVRNGTSIALRMTRPVSQIEGTEFDHGFSVTIPGALSLDRAAPISAQNALVRRAMILNHGDHSVLTVRFSEGRTPAYRVQARGSSLEVTIGR
jgi:hypothetical protein